MLRVSLNPELLGSLPALSCNPVYSSAPLSDKIGPIGFAENDNQIFRSPVLPFHNVCEAEFTILRSVNDCKQSPESNKSSISHISEPVTSDCTSVLCLYLELPASLPALSCNPVHSSTPLYANTGPASLAENNDPFFPSHVIPPFPTICKAVPTVKPSQWRGRGGGGVGSYISLNPRKYCAFKREKSPM